MESAINHCKWGCILLIFGAVTFLIGAFYPHGPWMLSVEDFLRSIHEYPWSWLIQNTCLTAGVVATMFGIGLFTGPYESMGGNGVLLKLSRWSFFIGAPFWLLVCVYRLTLCRAIAADFVQGGEIPLNFGVYEEGLFAFYSTMAFASLGFLGLALWKKPVCPRWLPYVLLVYGAGAIVFHFGVYFYHIPLVIHLPLLVLGLSGLRWLKKTRLKEIPF